MFSLDRTRRDKTRSNGIFEMTLTKDDIKSIMPEVLPVNLDRFCDPINVAMHKYEINTGQRQAMFIAQVAHECGQFNTVRELWGPTTWQVLYERDFNHAWPPTKDDSRNDSAYSLGNGLVGDGERYKGRGCIQITGKRNYILVSKALGQDFLVNPKLLEGPVYATMSAAWFWASHGLNQMADSGDFDGTSDIINLGHKTARIGDSLGYAERLRFYGLACKTLNIQ
jgi:putative chitinase